MNYVYEVTVNHLTEEGVVLDVIDKSEHDTNEEAAEDCAIKVAATAASLEHTLGGDVQMNEHRTEDEIELTLRSTNKPSFHISVKLVKRGVASC